jgi:hypothetical protein
MNLCLKYTMIGWLLFGATAFAFDLTDHSNPMTWTSAPPSGSTESTPSTASGPSNFDNIPSQNKGATADLAAAGEWIATSGLANPIIQGGKMIGRTYEAINRGDMTAAGIEAADGTGRLSAIGLGIMEGMKLGAAGGPWGAFIGGIVGGFIGKTAWDQTGGRINDASREQHAQNQANEAARNSARDASRNTTRPTRPFVGGSSGGGGGCGGGCPGHCR